MQMYSGDSAEYHLNSMKYNVIVSALENIILSFKELR